MQAGAPYLSIVPGEQSPEQTELRAEAKPLEPQ